MAAPPGFVQLDIETVGDERFVRGFNRYVSMMKDFRPVFDDIREDFQAIEKRVFRAQGTPESFAPLSEKYKKWKDRHYPGKPIMQLRGYLVGAMTGDTADTINRQRKKEAEFGTTLPYAHRHQMGTLGMPQRKFVQITAKDKTRWARMIQTWSYKQLREAVPGVAGFTR
jgi:phage gpG-like protein